MRETVTISLPKSLRAKLDKVVEEEQMNRSDVVRAALRQYLALMEFRKLREEMVPQGERAGIYTDEDVFEQVS